jgi:hypothetical protein
MNPSQVQAAVQSVLMILGTLASSFGFLNSGQVSSLTANSAIIAGGVAAIIGAIWNHTSAPTGAGK